jgi:hypothetical protein
LLVLPMLVHARLLLPMRLPLLIFLPRHCANQAHKLGTKDQRLRTSHAHKLGTHKTNGRRTRCDKINGLFSLHVLAQASHIVQRSRNGCAQVRMPVCAVAALRISRGSRANVAVLSRRQVTCTHRAQEKSRVEVVKFGNKLHH